MKTRTKRKTTKRRRIMSEITYDDFIKDVDYPPSPIIKKRRLEVEMTPLTLNLEDIDEKQSSESKTKASLRDMPELNINEDLPEILELEREDSSFQSKENSELEGRSKEMFTTFSFKSHDSQQKKAKARCYSEPAPMKLGSKGIFDFLTEMRNKKH